MDRPVLAHILKCPSVLFLPLIAADASRELFKVIHWLHLHFKVEFFDHIRDLGEEGIGCGVEEEQSFESKRVSMHDFGDDAGEGFDIDADFFGLKINKYIPLLNHATHQHELLQWS